MYNITRLMNGKWLVECRIQDGTERWHENNRQDAIYSLIAGARTLNGSRIREDDISFHEESPKPSTFTRSGLVLSKHDEQLLSDIKRGVKKVLEFDHYLLKSRITEKEVDMVIGIREGKLHISDQ